MSFNVISHGWSALWACHTQCNFFYASHDSMIKLQYRISAWEIAVSLLLCRGGQQRGGFGRGNGRGGFGQGGYGRQGQRGGGGGGNILLSPQVIGIFTNLFLQLPFSRRAEAEADLIGLKLMGLAGYDPQVMPNGSFAFLCTMRLLKVSGKTLCCETALALLGADLCLCSRHLRYVTQ